MTAPEVKRFSVPGVVEITPGRFGDERGYFAETYNQRDLAELGIEDAFVMDAESRSSQVHTLRGLHFQVPPSAQAKIVRVLAGAVYDVAVDIRADSETFGRHVAVTLHADVGNQLYIPVGFAHGFLTLEPETRVAYKLGAFYAPEHERGLLWNDPALNISWPALDAVVISDRDRDLPALKDLPSYFAFKD